MTNELQEQAHALMKECEKFIAEYDQYQPVPNEQVQSFFGSRGDVMRAIRGIHVKISTLASLIHALAHKCDTQTPTDTPEAA